MMGENSKYVANLLTISFPKSAQNLVKSPPFDFVIHDLPSPFEKKGIKLPHS